MPSNLNKLPFDSISDALAGGSLLFSILAQTATILVTSSEYVSGPGYVLQLDHFNEKTRLTEFNGLKCLEVRVQDNNCQEVFKKNVIIKYEIFSRMTLCWFINRLIFCNMVRGGLI